MAINKIGTIDGKSVYITDFENYLKVKQYEDIYFIVDNDVYFNEEYVGRYNEEKQSIYWLEELEEEETYEDEEEVEEPSEEENISDVSWVEDILKSVWSWSLEEV